MSFVGDMSLDRIATKTGIKGTVHNRIQCELLVPRRRN